MNELVFAMIIACETHEIPVKEMAEIIKVLTSFDNRFCTGFTDFITFFALHTLFGLSARFFRVGLRCKCS